MSVPAFIDITEEDQASELRAYIKSKGAEISEENSEGGLHVDLAQIIEACDVCLKDDDKEVESVMNSIVSLLLILETEKQEALIESLCEKLVKSREGERPTLRMQLLKNLFHGMDENAPVRYTVYCSLIKVAATCNAIAFIPADLDQVRKWITDWNLDTEKKHTLLRLVYEALVDCKKSEPAAKVMVELLGSYTEDNASQARVDAHRCIVRALKDPNTYLFDHLLALKPVRFLEGELIHDLLTIFVSAKLAAYMKFYENNKDFIDSLGLSHEQNMAKMRLLTFLGMAAEFKEISFDTMLEELQIGAEDVEAFVIDAVRTKMVYCKIDQTQRKVVVSHSTHRTFGKQQWQQLHDTLNSWKQNLSTNAFWKKYTEEHSNRPSRVDITALMIGLFVAGVSLLIIGLIIWFLCRRRCKGNRTRSPHGARRQRGSTSVITRGPEEMSLQPMDLPTEHTSQPGLPTYEQAMTTTGPHDGPPPPYPGYEPGQASAAHMNYPTSSFADQLASPAQTAAWAYERSTASIKPSSTYGATQPESELLQRQTYASTHQLPSYATAHHHTGLSGIFDAGLHAANSSTTEASVMSFLSAIESRTPQAGPATASLLPQFRTPSWQTGMNSSAATELFVTGTLPSPGTFPTSAALSTYQHPNSFSTRNFSTTPSLVLQDSSFTSSANGILSSQDPLLQIKPTQGVVPAALSFERLGGTALSASVPPQSSTYRSAQESAPHLLQPQFSLLSSALGGSQPAPQPYSTSVFTGSLERALQRECSVIKHHQRPSSTQSMQAQLPSSTQHSLQGYAAGSGGEVTFQSSPQQPAALPCSPMGDSTQVSDGRPQQKASQSTLEQTQAYISSPTFSSPSSTKTKDCSSRHAQQPLEAGEPHRCSPDLRPQSYPSPIQKQSPVIAGQPQPYTSGLMPVSPLQHYATSPTVPNSIGQVCSSSQSEKLPSFYKTLTAFSGQSGNVTPVSQSLVYSSGQQHGLLSVVRSEEYVVQCQGNPAQSFSSSHSQGLPTVTYSAQSGGLATDNPSQNYASGQSLESPSFSSTRTQSLPTPSPTHEYILMQPSPGLKTENTLSPQPQKYLPPIQSPPFSLASHSQALQNNQSPTDLKPPYGKRKSDTNAFVISKEEGNEFPVQELQALQQASQDPSAQTLAGCGLGEQNNVAHANSKMDDRYNSQSVIRSSMQPEDQMMGLALSESKKDDRMVSLNHHKRHMTAAASSQVTSDTKRISRLAQSSHMTMGAEELNKQHSLLHTVPESQLPPNHQMQGTGAHQQGQNHVTQQTQYIRLPSAQVLLEPSRDLQRILLQQPLLYPGLNSAKVSTQMQQIPVHYLQMDDQVMGANDGHGQQQMVLPHGSDVLKMDMAEASKSVQQQHPSPKDHFSQTNQQEAKHHFALSSICFPDSMLLGDERNILSNVDDILAATAAACGVTPQDFVKATSSEGEIPSLASPIDSKGHFQLVDTMHMSPSFSSPHPTAANTHTVAMMLNGGQLNIGIHQLSKGGILEHHALEVSNSHMQQELTTSSFNSRQDIGDRTVSSQHKPRSTSRESEGVKEEVAEEGTVGYSNGAFNSSGRGIRDESAASENDFHKAGSESDPTLMEFMNKMKLPKGGDPTQNRVQTVKVDDTGLEFSTSSFPKKKAKSKGLTKPVSEEENGHPKATKRGGQAKRQNSRGSDTSSPSTSDGCYDGYQQQERMRQKIREVEEKQPEVKTGFIGSFLDFLKSGPKQQFSSPPIRMPNRSRKAPVSFKRPPCPLSSSSKPQPLPAPLISPEADGLGVCKRLDEELKRNLEALPSFSSDEDDSVGKNQDLQKSITSALSALDDPSEKKSNLGVTEKTHPGPIIKQEQSDSVPPSVPTPQRQCPAVSIETSALERMKDVPADQLATQLASVAIEGLTDEDLSDSGGEGMYRERDEFVVKIEDIECFKMTLTAGHEPPAIWKVQKALLQKFVPELRDGTRVFSATNSYLGYFGDAKTLYRRVYVKFIDTVNKREYVRVCSRKPRCKPMHSMRSSHAKALLSQRAASAAATNADPSALKPASGKPPAKPRAKQPKVKAEPPPKKRRKWKEFSSPPSTVSLEAVSEDDEFTPPVPFASRFLNTRTMKEAFKSYVELLTSVALDSDVLEALEKENDELLLPHMKRVDGMITDNRRRLLAKLRVGNLFKVGALCWPVLQLQPNKRCLRADERGESFKVRLSGKAYHKKTMRPSKASNKLPLEYTVDKEKTQWFSLYHSLQHYKYHTFLMCKDEIASLQGRSQELGQEETVQLCMRDGKWVEGLFDKFGELLTQVSVGAAGRVDFGPTSRHYELSNRDEAESSHIGAVSEEAAVALNFSGTNLCSMHRPPDHGMANKPFRATYIWSSIINQLQMGVEVKRRRHNLKSYNDCFLGSEAVDVILAHITQNKFFGDGEIPRVKVVRVCQALMDYKVFEAVGHKVFGKEKKRGMFEDSSCSLYRFLNAQSHSENNLENGCDSPIDQRIIYRPHRQWQDEPVCSKATPIKTDKSLEDLLGNYSVNSENSPQMKVNAGLSQTLVNEVWRQQTILRLLQLVELPLLDSLLECRESRRSPMHSMDSDPDLLYTSTYLDREILRAFSDSQADDWLSAAVDCLEFLPDQLVVEVSRGLPTCIETQHCKWLVFQILEKHYSQPQHPALLNAHLFDIHTGITDLLVNGKLEQALEALQLCLKLLDQRSREELRRLLRFMAAAADPREVRLHKEIENRMAVKRAFSRAIVHSKHLAKGKVDLLVLFMLDNHHDVFKIPGSLHKLVGDKLQNIMNGKDPDDIAGPAFCQRVTGKACRDSAQKTTEDELWALLKTIQENPMLSAKEKKRLLGQFYKAHPEIFVQYLGTRISRYDRPRLHREGGLDQALLQQPALDIGKAAAFVIKATDSYVPSQGETGQKAMHLHK
ncbi:hypothetical protein AAFF_G00105880 [Aldrovandia affinis]|uniref:Eukaryotic translation initiation factor 3 subunit M n=1 Tax=Aldrovandia affinis TaxID=143900 RepID=A0AAD7WX97_9TELE|nr:hypothetical protein AAFF_G00105880 [Aldrovandia affinis]